MSERKPKGVFSELESLVDEYRANYDREMPAVVVGQLMLQLLQDRGWQRRSEPRVFFPGDILSRLADLTEAAGKRRSTEWIRTCATLPMEEWPPAPAYKGPMVPAAERDQLQARIDAALVELDRPAPQVSHGGNALWDVQNQQQQQVQVVRAALLRNQPTEPDTRCMNGPARERTLHMVGIIKALKSAAEMDHLPLEPPRRDNFARLARAIAGHWPRDIDRPSSPVDSGEAPANPEEQCAVAEPLNRHRCQRPAGHDVHRWSAGPLERDVWHCRPGEPVVTPRADPAVPSTPEEQP